MPNPKKAVARPRVKARKVKRPAPEQTAERAEVASIKAEGGGPVPEHPLAGIVPPLKRTTDHA